MLVLLLITKDDIAFPAFRKLLSALVSIKNSPLLHNKIREDSGLSIITPSKVRWLYIYLTLHRAFQLKPHLYTVKDKSELPSDSQWEELQSMKDMLESWYNWMLLLESSRRVNYSYVYPCIKSLISELEVNQVKN